MLIHGKRPTVGAVDPLIILIGICVLNVTLLELLGTPGYLAPEMIKRSVEMEALPYGKEIDL